MADSGHVPADAANRARSGSDTDDEEIAQAVSNENHNNDSNRDCNGHCCYRCYRRSRDKSIYQSPILLMKCVGEVANDAKRNENEKDYVDEYREINGAYFGCYNNNTTIYNDHNYTSSLVEDNDNVIPNRDLVENGDYDSGSTEGCDADDDDDDDDDEDEGEDFIDDDGPTEGCDVDNDNRADDRDDGGNGSTERGDTANEKSETSRKSAFFRFLERSNAFIRHILRNVFGPTQ